MSFFQNLYAKVNILNLSKIKNLSKINVNFQSLVSCEV